MVDQDDMNYDERPIKVFISDTKGHVCNGAVRTHRITSSSAECSNTESQSSSPEKAHILITEDIINNLRLAKRTKTIVEPRQLHINLNSEYSSYLEATKSKLPNVLEDRINAIFSARSVNSFDLPKPTPNKYRRELSTFTLTEGKSKKQRNVTMRENVADAVLDEAINNVAKANYMKTNPRLPELRAAQCKIYPKQDSRLDLLYATNKHGRQTHRSLPGVRSLSLDSGLPREYPVYKSYEALARTNYPDDRLPSVPRKPVLPVEMNSKEFVVSWLIHGSAPMTESHFPHVTGTDASMKKQKNSKTGPHKNAMRDG